MYHVSRAQGLYPDIVAKVCPLLALHGGPLAVGNPQAELPS